MAQAAFAVFEIAISVLILVTSTLGNSALLLVVRESNRKRFAAGNLLILNLAACDLLTPLLSLPFDLSMNGNGSRWLFGKFMCKVVYPSSTFTNTASSLSLAAISLDRYRALMHPFTTRLSLCQVKCLMVIIHVFSLLSVIPYVLVLQVNGEGTCDEVGWPEKEHLRQAYTVGLFLVQYGLPLIFMAVVYIRAAVILYKTSRKISLSMLTTNKVRERLESYPRTMGKIPRTGPKLLQRFRATLEGKFGMNEAQKQNMKITKTFVVIVIVFAVCMLPNQVVWLWLDFGDGSKHDQFEMIASICWFFTYANCCLNPVVFYYFSREFRERLKKMCRRMTLCVARKRGTCTVTAKRQRLKPTIETMDGSFHIGECHRSKGNAGSKERNTNKGKHSESQTFEETVEISQSTKRCAYFGNETIKMDKIQFELLPVLLETDC